MITAAIIIGLLAYYYFGPKAAAGIGVAIVVLNALALVRPKYALLAYAGCAVIVFGVAFMGPRLNKNKLDVLALVGKVFRQGRMIYKRILKRAS